MTWGPPTPFHTWSLSGALLNPSTCCRALDTIGFLLSRNSCSPSHRPKPRRRSRSPVLPQMGVGVGCWATVHWRRSSDPSHLSHSMEPLRKTSPVPDKASTTQAESRRQKSPPTSSLAQKPSSPHFCLHLQNHFLVLKETRVQLLSAKSGILHPPTAPVTQEVLAQAPGWLTSSPHLLPLRSLPQPSFGGHRAGRSPSGSQREPYLPQGHEMLFFLAYGQRREQDAPFTQLAGLGL